LNLSFGPALLVSSLSFVLGGCVSFPDRQDPPDVEDQVDIVFNESPASERQLSEAQLQDMVMDFADVYAVGILQGFDEIKLNPPSKQARTTAQYGKVLYTSAAVNIAAGQKPAANLLDMIVHVSLARHALETYWAPEVYGPSADRLRAAYVRLETEAWRMSNGILTPEQQTQLLGLIHKWIEANPGQHYVAEVRLSDFVDLAGDEPSPTAQEATGLLAEVDRAVAVADQALMVSERGMYFFARLPRTMTLQTELMIDQVTSTPEMQQMLLNTTRFADVSERLATVAEGLPQQLVEVRRTSRELFSDLNAQQAEIRPLIGDVQRTLETSSLLTDKINATIQALAPLYDRINASPTDFSDYLEALDRGIILVDRATTLLAKAEPLLGPEGQPVNPDFVDGILEHVDTHSQRVLDRGFTQGIILIGVFLFGLLLVLVTYKLVSLRIERAK
jgi:hypothetical protein